MSESATTKPQAPDTEAKTQKHRSPSYPSIKLETAVERATAVQKLAGTHAAPLAAIIKAWGYGAKSSNGILTVAALKKYGLTADSGKGSVRKISLTRLGHEILFFDKATGEWIERIQAAALTPSIYRELWNTYGPTLPQDSVMLHDLIFERAFSETAAREVLRNFRATVAYAQLADAGAMVDRDDGEDATEDQGDKETVLTPPALLTAPTVTAPEDPGTGEPKRSTKTVQVTYSPTEWALLQATFPMSGDDWDAMIDMLQAMKRGLVGPG